MTAPRQKGVLVILDGLGDRPNPSLDGKTPLEAAATGVLDELAATGQSGLVDPLAPGIPVDTATGTGLLLGAPPHSLDGLSRGPVEAAGVGLEVAPGDVALRCNFATAERADRGFRILDRRAGRIRRGTEELARALEGMELGDGVRGTVRAATQHRAVLRLSGPGLSAAISDTDPGVVPLPAAVLRSKARQRGDARASRTAGAVNVFVEQAFAILADHPVNRQRSAEGLPLANAVITRGAGLATTSRSFVEELGLAATVVAGESTVLGLAGLLAMGAISDPRFTGLPDTDLEAKVGATLEALEAHDVVFLHIKGADICSHDQDPLGKRDFLHRVDDALAPLLALEIVLGVTGDHSSDCSTGSHSGDPVPAILRAPGGRIDGVLRFGETEAGNGGLGRFSATAFLMSFLDAMGAVGEWRRRVATHNPPDGTGTGHLADLGELA